MGPREGELRILVAAGDSLARAGLAALLEGQQGCTVVGQLSQQEASAEQVKVFRPEAVLWDLGAESQANLEGLSELTDEGVAVLVLTAEGEGVAEVWHRGVRGLLTRETDAETLASALNALVRGVAVLDPELWPLIAPQEKGGLARQDTGITPREMEVLGLVAEGAPNKTLALRLGISEHTVKFHVNSIMGKLGAQSRTEAVVLATRLGLINL